MFGRLEDGTRFGVKDDFLGNGLSWSAVAPDGGTFSETSALGGHAVASPSDGTVAVNDEIYAYVGPYFQLKRQCPFYAAFRILAVEAAFNQAGYVFGLADDVAENFLLDNGAGVRTSGQHCLLYKLDGGSHWRAQSRDYYDFQDTVSTEPAGSLTLPQTIDGVVSNETPAETLEIFIDEPAPPYTVKDRVMVATFRRNGFHLGPFNRSGLMTAGGGEPIRHELSILNAELWYLLCGAKNGSAVLETLLLDLVYADQGRE